ncbi:hypothetical protein ACIPRL_29820 [Streptomyces sp. NPDC090085]|uniref:hypothetical protein n=1 Tax=Streptomyces sp. NPDC090085 TaxID=3365943 RepID=UPI00381071BC
MNVIALALAVGIASGMGMGMGMGHNSQARLITRGLAETIRLATAMGARPAALAPLAPASATVRP